MTQLENICNFVEISDWLSTAGQPTTEEFATIKVEGFTKVINLALSTSTNAIANEAEIVMAHGMGYVHIPVVWESPTIKDFEQFAEILNHSLGDKVFIHCAMNMRVSAFVYLYRRIYQSINHDVALKDLHKIWMPNLIWQRFIENIIHSFQPELPHIYTFAELGFPTVGVEFEDRSQKYTRPYIVFNMVASVDGKTTTTQGQMTGLGSRMDRQIMNRLRSQVDAIVVGGATFRNDPFIPTVPPELLEQRLQHFTNQPLGIVISNSGDLPLEHRFWQAGRDLRLVFLGAEASPEAEEKLAEKAQVFRLPADNCMAGMLNLLWQKFAVKTLMVEGGASLNYEFIAAGWSDELFLTICPKLVGGIKNSTTVGGKDYGMPELVDLKLRSLYQHENELYLRYQIESGLIKSDGGVA